MPPTTACSTSAPYGARPVPKGYVAIGYDELMRSMVYNPADVPVRHTRREIAEQLEVLYLQYDNEDFDLGIKQFMIEQAIQADLEDGMDKKVGGRNLERGRRRTDVRCMPDAPAPLPNLHTTPPRAPAALPLLCFSRPAGRRGRLRGEARRGSVCRHRRRGEGHAQDGRRVAGRVHDRGARAFFSF
jgi:hypothetical protein